MIVADWPPNIDEIRSRFPRLPVGVVFAWEGKIYAPHCTKGQLPADLVAHERVHFGQQARAGGAREWWRRYLDDPEFRLNQEIEAYRAQYASVAELSRPQRRAVLAHIVKSLASGMYGNLVTKERARQLILNGAAA